METEFDIDKHIDVLLAFNFFTFLKYVYSHLDNYLNKTQLILV